MDLEHLGPVQVEDLNRHQMDSEYFEVSTDTSMAINQARKRHRKIVAVGTSTVRALETIAISGFQVTPKEGGQISLFILLMSIKW